MATTESHAAFDFQIDLDAELNDLRASLLLNLAVALLALDWLWFFYNCWRQGIMSARDWPVLALLIGAAGALIWRKKNRSLASWALLLGIALAQGLAAIQYPYTLVMAFGAVGILLAVFLLGVGAAAFWGLFTWGMSYIAMAGRPDAPDTGAMLAVMLLYALMAGAGWLATRSLNVAVSWALDGWQRANEALSEVRARRAELYRALRALEEATYRIEKMNAALVGAQREAEESRALKARFVATVSHEIRGPLNLILGFSRLMALSPERYTSPLPPDYRADVATIYRSSQHLATLVDDILDLSQIEAGRLPLFKERTDLIHDVIEESTRIVQPLAERKGLYLRQALADDLPALLVDQVRLRQVMLNLLTNAVRFTERGGVVVRARLDEGYVRVSVSDTGPGIAQEEFSRIFGEFERISTSRSSEEKGSGLGLAISKQLVELHGGRIWVESTQGVGTTFFFTIPLPSAQALSLAQVRTGKGEVKATKEHVVVVHPDPCVVRLLARYLEGYRVVGAPSAREIVPLTEELHPRAIVAAPEASDAIHDLLAAKPYDVPIVSCAIPCAAEQMQIEGILSYLNKPVSPEAVMAIMRIVEREDETTVLLVDDEIGRAHV